MFIEREAAPEIVARPAAVLNSLFPNVPSPALEHLAEQADRLQSGLGGFAFAGSHATLWAYPVDGGWEDGR